MQRLTGGRRPAQGGALASNGRLYVGDRVETSRGRGVVAGEANSSIERAMRPLVRLNTGEYIRLTADIHYRVLKRWDV